MIKRYQKLTFPEKVEVFLKMWTKIYPKKEDRTLDSSRVEGFFYQANNMGRCQKHPEGVPHFWVTHPQ